MAFLHRGRARSTHLLEWKVGFFAVASVLALAGMALALRWMVWLAMGVLLVAFVMRWIPPSGRAAGGDHGKGRAAARAGGHGEEHTELRGGSGELDLPADGRVPSRHPLRPEMPAS